MGDDGFVARAIDAVKDVVGVGKGKHTRYDDNGRQIDAAKKQRTVLQSPQTQGKAPAPASERAAGKQVLTYAEEDVATMRKSLKAAESWLKAFGPPVEQLSDAVSVMRTFQPSGTENQLQCWIAARSSYLQAMKGLEKVVQRNKKQFFKDAAGAAALQEEAVAQLLEKNRELEQKSAVAAEVAAEASAKLQVTTAALHQSGSGHADIESAFPLSCVASPEQLQM